MLTRSPDLPSPSARARLRKADRLTQQQVADLLGVRRLAVARWEAGNVEPREPHRQAYIRLLAGLAVKYPTAVPDPSNFPE
ncbi:helix-turn-helix domain-containing protein [Streptomyces sp. NPDC053808]|uniref:helix-turn-helix domain-containing protein n=1 Tax=unclassified Streptomyces TaxID=2593676 RepID=UPI0033D7DE37